MAKNKMTKSPVQGGVRRRRTTAPKMAGINGDSTVVTYNVNGRLYTTGTTGSDIGLRIYAPGYTSGELFTSAGINVAKSYSTGKFLPGTSVRWEPSCSFTTSGRVYVAFSDNPEVIATMSGNTPTDFANGVVGMGNCISFPVWQETEIPFPTQLRRKRFDVNGNISVTADVLDRCAQVAMFVAITGASASTTVGNFWYHDKLSVEGLQVIGT